MKHSGACAMGSALSGFFLRERRRNYLCLPLYEARMGANVINMGESDPLEIERRSQPLVRKLFIDLSIMTLIGVIMALIGPFGSFEEPLATRLLVWLGLAYVGYCIYSPMGWVVERLHQSLDLPRGWLWVAASLVATVPMTMVVWSIGQLSSPAFRFPTASEALIQYCYVLIIGGGVTLLFNFVQRPDGTMRNNDPIPSSVVETGKSSHVAHPAPRLAARLSPAMGTQIIALEMEDHYVRVHTALGSELLLLRMRDAVAELDGLEGLRVHRSWWVARGAVCDVSREGRNIRLALENEIIAPVSRANVQSLKDAGWI